MRFEERIQNALTRVAIGVCVYGWKNRRKKCNTHRSCVSELAFFPFLWGCRDDFVGMETLADAKDERRDFSRSLKFAFPHFLFD